MSKNSQVFNQTLGLLDTLKEGLEHTNSLIVDGKGEEALEMIYDVLAGVESIISALSPLLEQLPANNLQVLEADMSDKFNKLIDIFKLNDGVLLISHLSSDLLPAFSEWKREIEKLLMPYILS
ncbi:MAG TPA: hypothetical protein VEF53_12170 [Patescibacteria group bacterium]|nr:hypothetical protein [Patescibacteria group bacterium]